MLNTIFMPELDSADYHEKQLRRYGITEINESTWDSDESGKDTHRYYKVCKPITELRRESPLRERWDERRSFYTI